MNFTRVGKRYVFFIIPMLLCLVLFVGANQEETTFDNGPQFVMANPAPVEIAQPDGSKITIRLFGDERVHYSQTMDGYTTFRASSGFVYYGELNSRGDLVISDTRAHNPGERTMRERNFLNKTGKDLRYSERQLEKALGKRKPRGENLDNQEYWGVNGTFPTTGNRRFLVILVGFADLSFVKSQSDFDTLLNGATNSFKDYYLDNSFNQLNVTTDVVGPYTLSGDMDTYGANDSQGYDINPRLMVQEGVDAAEADGVDFSLYDNDGNGYVDGIMVVHAGYGEEAGAPADTIWSHRWTLSSYARTYDGVTINDYTTVPELAGTSGTDLTGIGVLCHEFGHNLGAPDTYDTDYSGSGGTSFDLQRWDVMSGGSWNDNGNTPANFAAFHKWQFGWQTPTTISSAQTGVTLGNATDNNISYMITTPTSGEYFMLENRQLLGYDAYLPGHGMLIYHVDENWIATHMSNNLNAYPTHQGLDVEEADNIRSTATYGGDPFPGTSNITSFTDTTTPSSVTWASANTGKPITNIAENSGVITFDFMQGIVVLDMYVDSISVAVSKRGRSYRGTASIYIKDENGSPVSGALVYATWSGVVSGSVSATTDTSGKATFTSSYVRNTGPFTITVTNVTGSGYTYNSSLNNETSDSGSY